MTRPRPESSRLPGERKVLRVPRGVAVLARRRRTRARARAMLRGRGLRRKRSGREGARANRRARAGAPRHVARSPSIASRLPPSFA